MEYELIKLFFLYTRPQALNFVYVIKFKYAIYVYLFICRVIKIGKIYGKLENVEVKINSFGKG